MNFTVPHPNHLWIARRFFAKKPESIPFSSGDTNSDKNSLRNLAGQFLKQINGLDESKLTLDRPLKINHASKFKSI